MTTTSDGFTVSQTSASIAGAPTLLFIHGFLDDSTVWDGLIGSPAGNVNTVRYDLPGFGARTASVADPRDITLESLAAEAGKVVTQGRMAERLEEAYFATLGALAAALEAKDAYTNDHAIEIAELAGAVCEQLHIGPADARLGRGDAAGLPAA